MQYTGYIIDKLLNNHIYKIRVIHWISYHPFEQPSPDLKTKLCYSSKNKRHTFMQDYDSSKLNMSIL